MSALATLTIRKRHRIALNLAAATLLVAAATPLLAVCLLAFSPTYGLDFFANWHGASLIWFERLLIDAEWGRAFTNSSIVAALSTIGAMLLAAPAAVAWRLHGDRIAHRLLIVTGLSMCLPPAVLALGIANIVDRIGLFDTLLGLALAHVVVVLPVSGYVLLSRLRARSIDSYLNARALGANSLSAVGTWLRADHTVTLLSAATVGVLTSMAESTITIFVTDTRVRTIAKKALSGLSQEIDPSTFAALLIWVACAGALLHIVLKTHRGSEP